LEAQLVLDISIKYPRGAAVKTAEENREDVGVFHGEATIYSCPSRVFIAQDSSYVANFEATYMDCMDQLTRAKLGDVL
jgi:hypothetical protein